MAATCETLALATDIGVTLWVIPPGENTGTHVHEHDYSVVPVSGGLVEIISADTRVRVEMHRDKPYFRRAGASHDLVNVGDAAIQFVEVEFIR